MSFVKYCVARTFIVYLDDILEVPLEVGFIFTKLVAKCHRKFILFLILKYIFSEKIFLSQRFKTITFLNTYFVAWYVAESRAK